MGETAVMAAKAAKYKSAGTIEFLYDFQGKLLFYGNEYKNPSRTPHNRNGNRY